MKVKIVFFLTLLFVGIIVTPTIITLVDKNQDISVFFNLSEEEENHVQKTFKEIKIYPTNSLAIFFKILQKKKNVRFNSKNYISKYPKTTTPPPERLS